LGAVCNDVSLVNSELACRSGCSIRDIGVFEFLCFSSFARFRGMDMRFQFKCWLDALCFIRQQLATFFSEIAR